MAQHGTSQVERKREAGLDHPRNAGKRKKIELCAARFREERVEKVGPRGSAKVNLEIRFFLLEKVANRIFYGEFDSGSERTLAACLRHASRTGQPGSNTSVVQWRTGE